MADSLTAKTCVVEGEGPASIRLFQKSGIDIYRCASCDCIMADTGYDPDQYDEDSYYTMEFDDPDDIEFRWGFRWRYILSRIIAQTGSSATLLDVGAGNGFFIKLAQQEFGLAATGLEISPTMVEFAEATIGARLVNENLADHRGQYDVVTAFNVLEHVADPRKFMTMLLARLHPGGLLVISTPSPRCIQRRVHGLKNWKMICPPHHINIFTRRSLHILCAASGLEKIGHETISTYVKPVRRFDTRSQLLRRAFFSTFRALGLGADHLLFARRKKAGY